MGTSPIVTSPDSSWGTGIPTSWINIQVWRGNGVLDSLSHSPIFEHKHCQGLLRQYLTLKLHQSQETDLLQLEDLYERHQGVVLSWTVYIIMWQFKKSRRTFCCCSCTKTVFVLTESDRSTDGHEPEQPDSWISLSVTDFCVAFRLLQMALNIYFFQHLNICAHFCSHLSASHACTSQLAFSHVITANQFFVLGSSHKTREKEHRYASGAPH